MDCICNFHSPRLFKSTFQHPVHSLTPFSKLKIFTNLNKEVQQQFDADFAGKYFPALVFELSTLANLLCQTITLAMCLTVATSSPNWQPPVSL